MAHILATLVIAGSMAMFLLQQESRLVKLEEHRQAQISRDVRQDQDVRDLKVELAAALREARDELRALRNDLTKSGRTGG